MIKWVIPTGFMCCSLAWVQRLKPLVTISVVPMGLVSGSSMFLFLLYMVEVRKSLACVQRLKPLVTISVVPMGLVSGSHVFLFLLYMVKVRKGINRDQMPMPIGMTDVIAQ
jgi:hypothetical protein